MKSTRAKGLDYCREVRKILEGIGHQVDGPFYGIAFYNNRQNPIHRDIFGVYDLLSFDGQKLIGHQVSTDGHRSEKIRDLQEAHLNGWVWCRFHNDDQGTGYDVIKVEGPLAIENEMSFGLWRKPKVAKQSRDGVD